ncbi:OmpA family protein [Pararhizobium mangrovi]|uniref:OmpA-like domain-containing protein n=1 Tax=Pararhizobium mangrovi TaxID=2590452 RepID=A0A506TUW7_9HYPH|nr:OmpA family protein [Pararhizobium mangrovi]TPW25863.1 hypothetical protein FJU11_17375 [Pararhizobium mangrovi]
MRIRQALLVTAAIPLAVAPFYATAHAASNDGIIVAQADSGQAPSDEKRKEKRDRDAAEGSKAESQTPENKRDGGDRDRRRSADGDAGDKQTTTKNAVEERSKADRGEKNSSGKAVSKENDAQAANKRKASDEDSNRAAKSNVDAKKPDSAVKKSDDKDRTADKPASKVDDKADATAQKQPDRKAKPAEEPAKDATRNTSKNDAEAKRPTNGKDDNTKAATAPEEKGSTSRDTVSKKPDRDHDGADRNRGKADASRGDDDGKKPDASSTKTGENDHDQRNADRKRKGDDASRGDKAATKPLLDEPTRAQSKSASGSDKPEKLDKPNGAAVLDSQKGDGRDRDERRRNADRNGGNDRNRADSDRDRADSDRDRDRADNDRNRGQRGQNDRDLYRADRNDDNDRNGDRDRDTAGGNNTIVIVPIDRDKGRRVKERPQYELPSDARVERRTNDRVILNFDNRTIVENDDHDRIANDARNVYYEELSDGRTRQVVERPDGVRVVTIRNAYGDILHRSRIGRSGRETTLIYAPDYDRGRHDYFRDPQVDLPPIQLTEPVDDYILDARNADEQQYVNFLEKPPIEHVNRTYSLDQVRYSARLRDIMPRIDLDTITFDTGSARIDDTQSRSLEELGDAINGVLDRDPGQIFLIEGHTDAVGSDESNLVLSDERAESVASLLAQNFNVPPENLVTQGYGEQYLKIDTQGSERANRRVTVRRITPLVRPQTAQK